MTKANEKCLAIALITGSNPVKYGSLITHLSNKQAMGLDPYPNNVSTAYNMLINYVTPVDSMTQIRDPSNIPQPYTLAPIDTNSGITFAQSAAAPKPGSDGSSLGNIECYQCGTHGHYANNCPSTPVQSGSTLTQYTLVMAQASPSAIDPQCILLDSQSTISVFNNRHMLTDIGPSGHTLRALTNGGHQDSDMIGIFSEFGHCVV